jgi:hypothetical protein
MAAISCPSIFLLDAESFSETKTRFSPLLAVGGLLQKANILCFPLPVKQQNN